MKKVSSCIIFALLCSLLGCRSSQLSPKEYVSFVEDPENGLKKVSTIGDWIYKVQYRPAEYQLCKELDIKSLSGPALKDALAQKEQLALFNIYVEHKTYKQSTPLKLISKNITEYDQYEAYLLNAASGDLRLVQGKDTLQPVAYHFEPNYGLSPYDVIIVGFPVQQKVTEAKDMLLLYHDKVLRTGILQFKFLSHDLQNIPSISKL